MNQVGLSPALGTLLAGVVLANSEYRHELESDVEPFKGLLLGLFFISVGASLDVAGVAAAPGTVLCGREGSRPPCWNSTPTGWTCSGSSGWRCITETSLRAGKDALILLGTRAYAAHRATQTFRRHDEESMRRVHEIVDDRSTYLSTARARIEDLESLMHSDVEDVVGSRDEGWDSESLREEFGEG